LKLRVFLENFHHCRISRHRILLKEQQIKVAALRGAVALGLASDSIECTHRPSGLSSPVKTAKMSADRGSMVVYAASVILQELTAMFNNQIILPVEQKL